MWSIAVSYRALSLRAPYTNSRNNQLQTGVKHRKKPQSLVQWRLNVDGNRPPLVCFWCFHWCARSRPHYTSSDTSETARRRRVFYSKSFPRDRFVSYEREGGCFFFLLFYLFSVMFFSSYFYVPRARGRVPWHVSVARCGITKKTKNHLYICKYNVRSLRRNKKDIVTATGRRRPPSGTLGVRGVAEYVYGKSLYVVGFKNVFSTKKKKKYRTTVLKTFFFFYELHCFFFLFFGVEIEFINSSRPAAYRRKRRKRIFAVSPSGRARHLKNR